MQYTKSPRLLRLPEVTQITRLSRSSIYSYINAGIFPKSVSLGARSVAWVESEVLEWIDSRIQERDQIVAA
jgi:prophage regulatory protein